MQQNLPNKPTYSVDDKTLAGNLSDSPDNQPEKHTYGQILKSSAIIGGSSIITIVIRIIRTKIMALLLGTSGFGLLSLYMSIADLTQSVAGMGLHSSGVRQIAEAVGSDDSALIARTAQVLRRTVVFLGLLGGVFLLGFSSQLSVLTFGNDQHASGVALLSLAVFFNLVSAGQGALIQGMRKISELAKMNILGTLLGTLFSIPTVYYLGEEGIVPSLVLLAAMSLATSWWYRRKIVIEASPITAVQLKMEQSVLLKLGFAFMSSALMMTGSAYLIRLFVARDVGFDAAGLYQSAWALGGLYVGLILQAMGADFFPRLTAIVNDHSQCNRLVNEQAHVSLLLAGPGVMATLSLAPLVIAVFYTAKFEGAIDLLRWLCLGMTLRVISWPMGFIVIAKKAQNLFFFSELAWTIVYLALSWLCVNRYGLNGAGIAFFGSYIFHVLMTYTIVRRLSDFRMSNANLKTTLIFLSLIAIVFTSFYFLSPIIAMVFGTVVTVLSAFYSIHAITNLVSPDRVPQKLIRLLSKLKPFVSRATSDENIGKKPVRKDTNFFRLFGLILGLLIISASIWLSTSHCCMDWRYLSDIFKSLLKLVVD